MGNDVFLPNGVTMDFPCPWCGLDLTDACDGRVAAYDNVLSEHVQTCEPWPYAHGFTHGYRREDDR